MKRIFMLLVFLIAAHFGYADIVRMVCPDPAAVQFHRMKLKPAWDQYIAQGLAKIIQGNAASFAMAAKTKAHNAEYLEWATYYRADLNNDFICLYSGKDDTGNKAVTVLADYEPQEVLSDCHFKVGDPFECDATKHVCELVCITG